jgi:hypothetical protein
MDAGEGWLGEDGSPWVDRSSKNGKWALAFPRIVVIAFPRKYAALLFVAGNKNRGRREILFVPYAKRKTGRRTTQSSRKRGVQ